MTFEQWANATYGAANSPGSKAFREVQREAWNAAIAAACAAQHPDASGIESLKSVPAAGAGSSLRITSELWAEDCFMEKNRLVECPDCCGLPTETETPTQGG